MDGQTHKEASGHCSQTEKSTTAASQPARQPDKQMETKNNNKVRGVSKDFGQECTTPE